MANGLRAHEQALHCAALRTVFQDGQNANAGIRPASLYDASHVRGKNSTASTASKVVIAYPLRPNDLNYCCTDTNVLVQRSSRFIILGNDTHRVLFRVQSEKAWARVKSDKIRQNVLYMDVRKQTANKNHRDDPGRRRDKPSLKPKSPKKGEPQK